MSKWIAITTKITEEEKEVLEDYLKRYNSLYGTVFSRSGFVRFLLGKNAEIFNKKHPE